MRLITTLVLLCSSSFVLSDPITAIESSGSVSSFTSSPLYTIGIYEPDNEHGWKVDENGKYYHFRERGEATVYISEQSSESVSLALGAYEPTDWNITGPGADNVTTIVLFGYHSATVSGYDASAVVYNKTYKESGSDYIRQVYSWNASNRASVINEIESLADTNITSFTGAYNAVSFRIDAH